MVAIAFGMINGGSWFQSYCLKNNRKANNKRFCCSSSSSFSGSLTEQYKTLRIQPGSSETEIKKAFRQLALQVVMSNLRGESNAMNLFESDDNSYNDNDDESMRGMCDPDWDLWEEWMGWEGAGIRDYSSHINPYI